MKLRGLFKISRLAARCRKKLLDRQLPIQKQCFASKTNIRKIEGKCQNKVCSGAMWLN